MNYFVTTSIPYVNGEPHIGHAMELVLADVLARAARQQGKPVIFSTGTDEHGSKVAEKAESLKLKPKEFADKISQQFRDLQKLLDISNDRFIRTTDAGHEQRAQIIWKAIEKDVYKSKYIGLYCVGCEAYVTEAVAKENAGVCPHHKTPYQKLEEENYFFKLSKYGPEIQKAIDSGAFQILPATRKHEILHLIKEGLEDISISRPKEKISWGIAVPGDPNQVMYVWFEALMNYITVLGYPEHEDFKTFWPANVQVIGKDILRFHAAIWPGMLLALGLPLPKALYVHGFVNINGEKISKSLGNVVHPKEIVDKYGVDAFRYYFLRHIPSYGDGVFTWELIDKAYNNELANELGNAVQRTVVMIQKYQNGLIGDIPAFEHDVAQYNEALELCKFDRALDEVWEKVRGLNQYIDEEKPWTLAKNKEDDHLKEVLAYQVSCLLQIADMLTPFLPSTAEKIKNILGTGIVQVTETTLFPRLFDATKA
ncbi:MAG: methionine--tRNA ligase [Candidatus Saccharibacteria bacterium]|nr:methionine--tRNA ligase [Candidatus Saccharibacteria bacterium]